MSEFNFDTKILRYIVAIMDEQSLSKAAEKMYLAQPALSRHLRKVEEELGAQLFSREHHELRPTDAGKIFVNGARRILHLEQDCQARMNACRHDRKESLYLISEEFYAQTLENQLRPAFGAAFPNIGLHIETSNDSEIKKRLSEGTADLGIFIGNTNEQPFYQIERTFSAEVVFCAAERGTNTAQQTAFSLNDYKTEPMLLSPRGSFLRQLQDQTLRESEITQPKIICEANLDILAELIHLGYGNTLILRRVAQQFAQKERIFSFSPKLECNAVLARSQESITTEHLHFCIEFIEKVLSRF